MTTAYLAADLRRDEGLRLQAYPDPISRGEPWTIGYGHTGPEVVPGLVWTEAQAEAALAADLARAEAWLDRELSWWRGLDDVRQDVLADMAFNMGRRLLGFEKALGSTHAGEIAEVAHMAANDDFAWAADELLDSVWARQVGGRAQRLAEQMRTGLRAAA